MQMTKLNMTQHLKFVLGLVKSILGKGENAVYQHFLLFPKCFQKASLARALRRQDCVVRYIMNLQICTDTDQALQSWVEIFSFRSDIYDILWHIDSLGHLAHICHLKRKNNEKGR